MEIKVLGSAGGQAPGLDTTAFRLGSDLLLDAGAAGLYLPLAEQRALRHVLLTHTHLDHLHALPFLLDNLVGRIPDAVTVYATGGILDALHRHVFNGLMWPDFTVLPTSQAPVIKLHPIVPGLPFAAGAYQVEAVPVEHSVPALGYLITGADGTVVFTGDTGPTTTLWESAARAGRLRAVFIETSFPASHQEFAGRTRHLTTADVPRELAKAGLDPGVPVFLYHLKPEFTAQIEQEAAAIKPWRVRPVKQGEVIKI
jgi:ribonuclease BN (tRNA processing enzyme)